MFWYIRDRDQKRIDELEGTNNELALFFLIEEKLTMVKPSNSGKLKITSDAMNKWKIPHYYKRSGKNSATSTPVSEVTNSPLRLHEASVSSPKKIVLEDRNRATPRSRKSNKKGQMVFVNYTVQDEERSSPQPDQQAIDAMKEAMVLESKGLSNRKTSRRRMLKIFGSSREEVAADESGPRVQSLENVVESSSNTSSSASTPNSARKSYSSFLKYNRQGSGDVKGINGGGSSSSSNNNNASVDFNAMLVGNNANGIRYSAKNNSGTKSADELSNMMTPDEIVPKSSHDPSLAKPPRATISDRKRSISSSAIPMKVASTMSLNSKVTKPGRKLSTTTTLSNPSSQNTPFIEFENADFSDSYHISDSYYNQTDNLSSASLASFISNPNMQDNNNTLSTDITNMDTTDKLNNYPIAYTRESGEENDASIAFTKMFGRQRANTGGSTGSSTSSNTLHTGLPPKSMVNKVNNHRTTSMNSLSSISNKFSPIRTVSPVRPRSNTRTSSGYRQSRDLTAVAASIMNNETNVVATTGEMFLDGQGKRNLTHKKKQDSISDTYKLQNTPSASNNSNNTIATTPSSLLGNSYFSNNLISQNSYSNTSTPAATDNTTLESNYFSGKTVINSSRQTSDISILADKDFLFEGEMFENADIPTPVERVAPIRGISVTAIQEIDEEEKTNERGENDDGSQEQLMNMINSEKIDRKIVPNFHDKFDGADFQNNVHGGSCTSSSAMDSLMTNYLYPTNSNGTGLNNQERDEQFIENNGFDGVNFDFFDKQNLGTTTTVNNIDEIKRSNENFEDSYQYNFDHTLPTGQNSAQHLDNEQQRKKSISFNVNSFQQNNIDYVRDDNTEKSKELNALSNNFYFDNQY